MRDRHTANAQEVWVFTPIDYSCGQLVLHLLGSVDVCVALHSGHMMRLHTARVTHTLVCTGYVFSVTLIYDCALSYF